MSKHVFNLRKDASDARDHLALRGLAALPPAVDLSANLGPVRDQGSTGSCCGQAGAGFMDWLYNTMRPYFSERLSPVQFSALFLYAKERILDGDFPSDSGSDSRTLMRVLNREGICPNVIDPFVDSEAAIAAKPTDEMDREAIPFRIGAYHRVLFDNGLVTSRSVLASGYCHVIGIPVYAAIESDEVAQTGLLPIPAPGETEIGGHELVVYGYLDAEQVHLVRNSWGADWGLGGNLKIPYGYYAAVGGNTWADAWVGHLGKPWA